MQPYQQPFANGCNCCQLILTSPLIRRAKGRARHIASFARNKGTSVQITKRGITLDHVFYPYNRLDSIPSIYIPPRTLFIPSTINNNNSQTNRIPADTNQNPASTNHRSTNPLPPPLKERRNRLSHSLTNPLLSPPDLGLKSRRYQNPLI